MSRARPILITAGGTGGHVYPALAVAQALRERGVPVVWLGTRRGLEARVVPQAGIAIAWLSVSGLRGKGWLSWGLAPFRLAWAGLQAAAVLLRTRPRLVLGMGGFVSGPGAFMAWLLRIPVVVQEQNAVAGLTNRILAHIARRTLEGFRGTFPAQRMALYTGNPVRADIAALPPPEQRGLGADDRLRLLVLGGSQGARALNAVLPEAMAGLPDADRPRIRHQSGPVDLEQTREAYRRAGVQARVEAYIDDMAQAYGWADLVICRSGALTVAELAAAGVGAILVPFPHAVDDHQTANARYLVQGGAAELLPQSELTAEGLRELVLRLKNEPGRLLKMAQAARALAAPEATRQVVEQCLALAAGAERGGRRA